MKFEVLEPYSFHSAKVTEMLLLTYFTEVALTGMGLGKELPSLRNLWTHF